MPEHSQPARVRRALALTALAACAACGAGGAGNAGAAAAGTRYLGSDAGRLPPGVTAVGIAADQATGGYWIARSDGVVDAFGAPAPSLAPLRAGAARPVAITAAPGGFLLLTSDGGVIGYRARVRGSDAGALPAGVRATGIAADPATGGYWIARSDGGVDGFGVPVRGSLAGHLPYASTVSGIAAAGGGGYRILLATGGALPADLRGDYFDKIPTSRKVVALTFDVGPVNGIASTLATLRRYHVPATFFLVGGQTLYHQRAMRAIAAAGELIGNHSSTHPRFTQISDAMAAGQLRLAQSRIEALTGAGSWPWFRFPYGDHDARTVAAVNAAGYATIGWTVDSLGWMGSSGGITVDTVVSRVLASLQPGAIVLMHGGTDSNDRSHLDADAIKILIPRIRALGYRFVAVDAIANFAARTSVSDGLVRGFRAADHGSDAGRLPPGVTAIGIAADPATGGYRILTSAGGVNSFGVPGYGSVSGRIPERATAAAITAGPGGGYLVLTSDGSVFAFRAKR